jgi:nitroreductase
VETQEETAMPILAPIEKRRAYRALSPRPIPAETLVRLAQAAHMAPSCANAQPWRIITVTEGGHLSALKETLSPGNYWAQKAPAIAAFVTRVEWDGRLDRGRDYAFFDLGQAAMNYQLQAVAEGLIAHPIAGFNAEAAAKALGVPEGAVLVTLVILGYPGETADLNQKHLEMESSERSRKALEMVHANDAWLPGLVPPAGPKK